MYLLDTNVVSELRRSRPHAAVLNWIESVPEEQLYLSAVTIGEIQAGIEVTRQQDPSKAEELERWLDGVMTAYEILPVDASAFRVWAKLMHRQSDTFLQDTLIAAVAIVHDLTVVTRNGRDFEHTGVRLLDPFAGRNE